MYWLFISLLACILSLGIPSGETSSEVKTDSSADVKKEEPTSADGPPAPAATASAAVDGSTPMDTEQPPTATVPPTTAATAAG